MQEYIATNKKVMDSMQKTRDLQVEQMNKYQAELQDKKLLDIEVKKLKQQLSAAQERVTTMKNLHEANVKNSEYMENSIQQMINSLEVAKQERTEEILDIIFCINQVVQKGKDKAVLMDLQSKIKNEYIERLKPFFIAYKIKL